jgi:hypothetical protein
MPFDVPNSLFQRLRDHWGRPLDAIEREYDAVILDGGLGTALYLTRDGRVIVDGSGWDDLGVREGTRAESLIALIVGARKTGEAGLLELLPARSPDARDCQYCNSTGWIETGDERRFVCITCGGVGWLEGRREF